MRHEHRRPTGKRTGDGKLRLVEPARLAVDRARPRADALEQIVHDLRGPLGAIALEASLLDDTLASATRSELRISVERITRNAGFLDRMIQDLLDAASIANGRLVLQREPTELRALLAQLVDRVVSSRDHDRVVVEAAQPLTLSLDTMRIERVVTNLLHNALKYAPPHSRIVLRLELAGGCGRISVIDAGPGLTSAEAAYIFDKYHRTASARAHQGSGLGLHLSKQIVEAHGGTIGVDSVPGGGSRFFIELPADHAP